jgi:hypothetical protein
LIRPWRQLLIQHVAPPVPPPASAPVPVPASSEPHETAAVAAAASMPALTPPMLTAAPVPPPASAPAPVSASSEPKETAAVPPAASMPALAPPALQHLSRRLPRLRRLYRSRLIQMLGGGLADDYPWRGRAATPSSITIQTRVIVWAFAAAQRILSKSPWRPRPSLKRVAPATPGHSSASAGAAAMTAAVATMALRVTA